MRCNGKPIGLAAIMLLATASQLSALPQDRPASLLEDIRQYYLACGTVNATSPKAQNCSKQKSVLLGRQKALGVGNESINALLNGSVRARGGARWPS